MQKITVTILQYDVIWKDKEANFSKIRSLLKSISSSDLIVLPEMFQTGFCVDDTSVAEASDGLSVQFMQEIATAFNCTVVGSIILKKDHHISNSMLMVNSAGVTAQYNKMHLFSLSNEDQSFSAGNEIIDASVAGIKVRLAICYDLRFPQLTYNNTNYDALIISANWPVKRIKHWDALLKARAIENQAYVVGVNRVGVDPEGVQYPGHSSVYDALGNQVIRFIGEEVQQVLLDFNEQARIRKDLPFLKDQKL